VAVPADMRCTAPDRPRTRPNWARMRPQNRIGLVKMTWATAGVVATA